MADFDPALMQQVFDVPERKWEPNIHHNRQADDLWARLEVLERGAFCHPEMLGVPLTHFNQISSDSTRRIIGIILGRDRRAAVDYRRP